MVKLTGPSPYFIENENGIEQSVPEYPPQGVGSSEP